MHVLLILHSSRGSMDHLLFTVSPSKREL